jgi:hypothetical protein
MSKQRTKKASDEKARVKIGKLSPPEKEVKNREATNIKGGGGVSGGVLGDKSDQTSRLGR